MDSVTKEAFESISGGADIYSRVEAGLLRDLEDEYPGMIDIGEARAYTGDGTDQKPFFGAVLTDKGRSFLAMVTRHHIECGAG